jgi:hypothetical protein
LTSNHREPNVRLDETIVARTQESAVEPILRARLEQLDAEIERAHAATRHAALGRHRRRVELVFDVRTKQLRSRVAQLRGLVENIETGHGDLAPMRPVPAGTSATIATSAPSIAAAWALLAECQAYAAELRELREFVEGALLREAGIDGGFLSVADDLVEHHLAKYSRTPWTSLVIHGEFTHTTGGDEIIRLAFPSYDVWSLPFIAHEYGHHVVSRLEAVDGSGERPLRDFIRSHPETEGPLNDERSGTQMSGFRRSWVEEAACDLFGLYAVGPALALALVHLERSFDPRFADRDQRTHPPANLRVALLMAALDLLGHRLKLNLHGFVARHLRERWKTAVTRATGVAPGTPPTAVQTLADDLLDLVIHHLPAGLAYTSISRANVVKRILLDGYGQTGVDTSIADVLNGAWLARLHSPAAAAELNRWNSDAARLLADLPARRVPNA